MATTTEEGSSLACRPSANKASLSKRVFAEFAAWLETEGTPIDQARDETLVAYVKHQSVRRSPLTIRNKLVHVKRGLIELGVLPPGAALRNTVLLVSRLIREHKPAPTVTQGLDEAQTERYLAADDPTLGEVETLQVRLVMHLHARAGLRLEEIQGLLVGDVAVDAEGILVSVRSPDRSSYKIYLERAGPDSPPGLCPQTTLQDYLALMPWDLHASQAMRLFLRPCMWKLSAQPRGIKWFVQVGEHVARVLGLPDPSKFRGNFARRSAGAKQGSSKARLCRSASPTPAAAHDPFSPANSAPLESWDDVINLSFLS